MKDGSKKNRDRGGAPANRDDSKPSNREAITYYVSPSDAEKIRQAAEKERIGVSAFSRRAAVRDAENATD